MELSTDDQPSRAKGVLLLLAAICVGVAACTFAWPWLGPKSCQATELSRAMLDMGVGINLGNTYELDVHDISFKNRSKIMLDSFWDKGFRTVRIPIHWGEHFNGTSEKTQEATQTVRYALQRGFYVIINAHHEKWLHCCYDGSKSFNDKFTTLWVSIARHFDWASERLFFEVLNEPFEVFGGWYPAKYPKPSDRHAIELTRQIMQVGHAAIRQVNQTRVVLVSPNAQSSVTTVKSVFPHAWTLPGNGRDPFVGVTLHTYQPWKFCGQDGNNNVFPNSSALLDFTSDFWADLQQWYDETCIPINIGEFGFGRRKDQQERNTSIARQYYYDTTRLVRSRGWSIVAWDDQGWFALTQERGKGHAITWPFRLANAILKGEMVRSQSEAMDHVGMAV